MAKILAVNLLTFLGALAGLVHLAKRVPQGGASALSGNQRTANVTGPPSVAKSKVNGLPVAFKSNVTQLPAVAKLNVTELPAPAKSNVTQLPAVAKLNVTELPAPAKSNVTQLPAVAKLNVTELPAPAKSNVTQLPAAAASANVTELPTAAKSPIVAELQAAATSANATELPVTAKSKAMSNVTQLPVVAKSANVTEMPTAAKSNITQLHAAATSANVTELPVGARSKAIPNVTEPPIVAKSNVTGLPLVAKSKVTGLAVVATPDVTELPVVSKSNVTERRIVDRWYDPQCMNWFRGNATVSLQRGQRPSWFEVPWRVTREDLCEGGRFQCCLGHHLAQEVVVVDDARMIYVKVRKVASSHISSALQLAFGVTSNSWCRERPSDPMPPCVDADFAPLGRCTSQCLKPKHQTYYVFSFVRNPLTRVYASLVQAPDARTMTLDSALSRLGKLMNGACNVDHHLESQSRSLSTPLPPSVSQEGRRELPIDFIGRLEHLVKDMERVVVEVLGRLNASERAVAAPKLQHFMRLIRGEKVLPPNQAYRKRVHALRGESINKLAQAVYSQDCACFGCKDE